jgi:hypothetical protein
MTLSGEGVGQHRAHEDFVLDDQDVHYDGPPVLRDTLSLSPHSTILFRSVL